MSTLTPSKVPDRRLFGVRIACVDKQSVNGDRTTTRSCHKVALNRFGIANASLRIAKFWLLKPMNQNSIIKSNIEMRSIEIGREADDDDEASSKFDFIRFTWR